MNLKAALNSKLRTALVGVKLPPPDQYDDWVERVKEVALELKGLASYRLRGATQITTKLGAPKSEVGIAGPSRPVVDAEGDVRMGGTNAIVAAFGGTSQDTEDVDVWAVRAGNEPRGGSTRGTARTPEERSLPRAPWRSQEELQRLMREGVCLRCTQGGHRAKHCPRFRRAQAPRSWLSAAAATEGQGEDGSP
ncbi:hypothetical protein K3495_g11621 [Podosphaera aphanis]|nr:hypothetical protein K3495_g11621 [Podosphaera aphanis]